MATLQYGPGDEPIPGSGYRVVSFLGRGGFGEVWKARAPGGAETALKIIRLGGREGRKELRALQLVKRIRHPNLVPIFGFWLKGKDGLVLDDASIEAADVMVEPSASLTKTMFVPGVPAPDAAQELIIAMGLGDKSLFDRLEECRNEGLPGIPPKELLGYLEDCAEAIDFLNRPIHDLGMGRAAIQHCDIKPHNLMIVGGCAQVCDFGLARMMGCDRATTAAGSIAYAAPETLIENQPSSSTDQYSLAITYYELKTNKLPFPDDSLVAILDAKREEKLDFSDLPAAEQGVLRRATLRNPDERYASCREMIEALRDATSSADRPLVKRARRSLLPWVVVFLVLGVSAGGAWFAWLRPWPFGRPTAVTPAPIPAKSHATSLVQTPDRPKNGEAFLERGTQTLSNQDFVAAIPDLEQAAKFMPREAKVFSRLGAAWSGQKRWDKAVESYTTAIEIEPHPLDYEARGRAYRALRSLDNAIADFRQSVELNPKNAQAYAELGDAYLDKENPVSAIPELSKAVQICRTDPKANFREFSACHLRAYAYLKLGKIDDAAADLERVFDLAQSDQDRASSHDLFYALSVKLAEAKRYADAVRWIKKAIELAPDEVIRNTYRERLKTYSAEPTPVPPPHPNP
ncbi:MAG: tetratricopeptide repeat protein [Planctomycetota bacterium]